MQGKWIFDGPGSQEFVRVRQEVLGQLLPTLRSRLSLVSALDVGCGVGYFSKFLLDAGFNVVAVDGREENANEARKRFPGIDFVTGNIEDISSAKLGTFDFVLCVGLLYHLESPLRAIRNLKALTSKVLFVESMCSPGDEPTLELLDEYETEDQGLNYLAFYPTESCLTKMLYRAGFSYVYGFRTLPNYWRFRDSPARRRERTMCVASYEPLVFPQLELLTEPKREWDLWSIPPKAWRMRMARVADIIRKPKHAKGGKR